MCTVGCGVRGGGRGEKGSQERRRRRKAFMECQTPIEPRKVASCQGVRSPVWELGSSSKWLLASNPTPGCRSDVLPMKGGAQPLDFHHTLIQAFSQLLMFWPVHCGHRTVRIGRQLREKGLWIRNTFQSGCPSSIRG